MQAQAHQCVQTRHDLALRKVLGEGDRTMKLTEEQKQAIPQKRANRKEIDAYYGLAAALSCLFDAAGVKDDDDDPGILCERARLVPGCLRDLRCATAMITSAVQNMKLTFEPEKRRSISRQMQHLRIRTVFGPEAHKEPEMFMIPIEDLGLLVQAATEACKVRMCAPGECSQCELGRAIDRASFVSRGNRAWWEVFDQMVRGQAAQEGTT